jgi:DNA-binding NarL/FixJ family response regulator
MPKKLTSKQLEILTLYGRTGSAKQTAELLYISERTVRNTLCTIYERLGVNNGVAAVWKVFVEGDG